MRLVIFFIVITHFSPGQENDSLVRNILSLKNDTEVVNLLYRNGFASRNQDPARAMKYAELSEQIARRSTSKKHIAKANNLLGILFYKKGDYKKALAFHNDALSLRMQVNDLTGQGYSHTNLGNIYSELRLYGKAETHYLEALEIAEQLSDEKSICRCLINLGVLNQTLHKHEAAFENYSIALEVAQKLSDYELQSLCLNNIAQVYFDRKDFDRCISFNQDALKMRQMMDNEVEAADSYLNLAQAYLSLKNFELAKEQLDEGYKIALQYDYYDALQVSRQLYSRLYAEKHQYDLAFSWLNAYNTKRDSTTEANALDESAVLKSSVAEMTIKPTMSHLKNTWLLVSVFIFMILVPLNLARFKR